MLKLSKTIIPRWRLVILSAVGGVSIGFVLFASPTLFVLPPDRPGCDTPIQWSLAEVDSRFPLSQNEFRKTAFEAEMIWEKAIGKELFVFDNSAPFQLRTLFDDRQKMTYEGQALDKNIEEYEKVSDSIEAQYNSLQKQYKNKKIEFDILSEEFDKDAAAYEKEVAKWNERGGAPADVYEKLEVEQKSLDKRTQEINTMGDSINELVKKINTLAGKFNVHTAQVNSQIETFQEKYGEPTPFIQGLYQSPLNNITIFQFQDQGDLRLVIAHEFGHALGIQEHVSDPTALMHFLMDQQDIFNPQLSQEDIEAYELVCPARNFSVSEKLKRYLVLTPWEKMRPQDFAEIFK